MSSVEAEQIIFTVADGSALGQKLSRVDVDTINVVDINISGTLNGTALTGSFVFTDSVQTLTNKSLADDTCAFVDAVDPTVGVFFDAGGATGTAAVLQFTQATNRTYTIPDSGADCDVVMTEGAQTINGLKTFTDLIVASLAVDSLVEVTPDHGVIVDNICIREDILYAPAITIAYINPVGLAADIPLALIPKGAGSLLASVPDDTAVGGNVRGNNAVDFQINRASATQVASGGGSFIGAGTSNTSSGQYSIVGGGSTNTASGNYSAILGGAGNTASGDYAQAGGRRSQAVNSGAYVISDSSDADFLSTAPDQYNSRYAGGYRVTGGQFSWNDVTTLYTSGSATTVGAVTSDIYTIVTSNNTLYMFTLSIIGATASGNSAVFRASARAKNVGGVVTLGTTFDSWSDNDAALIAANVSFIVSGGNVIVRVTGVAAQTIAWRGDVKEVKLSF